MSKSLRWVLAPIPAHPAEQARRRLARSLRRFGACLMAMSRRLQRSSRPAPADSAFFEFHAEAGAPEGALFVDGVRVGSISGVTRL